MPGVVCLTTAEFEGLSTCGLNSDAWHALLLHWQFQETGNVFTEGVRSFQSANSHLHRVSTERQAARSHFPDWQ